MYNWASFNWQQFYRKHKSKLHNSSSDKNADVTNIRYTINGRSVRLLQCRYMSADRYGLCYTSIDMEIQRTKTKHECVCVSTPNRPRFFHTHVGIWINRRNRYVFMKIKHSISVKLLLIWDFNTDMRVVECQVCSSLCKYHGSHIRTTELEKKYGVEFIS
jgi:hypothetical protein